MYYGDSQDPYYNLNLKYYQKAHLPLDEFAKGNFSQAHKIIDTYRAYIKNCITSLTHQHTGGEKTISEYLKKQLAELEQQHKERTEKKNQALENIKNIQKDIDDERKAFQEEGKGDKYRNIFVNFLKKTKYNINMTENTFNNSKKGKSEEFIENVTKIFETFLSSAYIRQEKFDKLGKKIYHAKNMRNEATHILSHKSNRMNLEEQIDDLTTGRKSTEIENSIKKDILKIFKKMDHTDRIVDKRSLQEMFTSIMATQLITDCNTDKQIKKNLIRNHTDKLGLFDHVRRIYHNNTPMFLNIETGRNRSKGKEHYGELIKEKAEEIVEESRKILEKIPAISGYFRLSRDASEEDIETRKNKGDKEWKNIIIEDLISHLREILNAPKEKGHRRREPDNKLKKLFEGIYTITESHEFERYCEKLWNIDANRYREILGTEGKMMLKQIYQTMDEEEQSIITSEYKHRGIYESVIKDIEIQKEHEQEKQLKLFNLAPIYNNKGYVEHVSEHIESLMGRLSLDHKRKFEGIVQDILAKQGHDGYIDTGKEITPLSEEEFIQRVKESRGGKALSLRLKKFEGKLLPDINEWIAEMKKIAKGDII